MAGSPQRSSASGTLALVLMLRTARLGGDINHPEIRVGVSAEGSGQGLSAAIVDWVGNDAWAFPAMETVHFLGMALLFGAVTAGGASRAWRRPDGAVCRLSPAAAPGRVRLRAERRHRGRSSSSSTPAGTPR